MAVSKRLRHEVMRRDNYTCKYCRSTENKLTIDHVVPETLGGTDDPSNLVAACADCNAGKSASSPDQSLVAEVEKDSIRWSAAMQRAGEEIAGEQREHTRRQDAFNAEWRTYCDTTGWYFPLGPGWRSSVDGWLRGGLSIEELLVLIDDVMGRPNVRDRWTYFCGAARNVVQRRQERARELLAAETAPAEDVDLDEDEVDEDSEDESQAAIEWHVAGMDILAQRLEHVDTRYWCAERNSEFTLHVPFTRCLPLSVLVNLISNEMISAHSRESAEAGIQKGHATVCADCCAFDPSRGTRAALSAVCAGYALEAA